MNEKGKQTLPRVFWSAFPNQKAAYKALEDAGLVFTRGEYADVWSQLAEAYDAEALGRAIAACVRSRVTPEGLVYGDEGTAVRPSTSSGRTVSWREASRRLPRLPWSGSGTTRCSQ